MKFDLYEINNKTRIFYIKMRSNKLQANYTLLFYSGIKMLLTNKFKTKKHELYRLQTIGFLGSCHGGSV